MTSYESERERKSLHSGLVGVRVRHLVALGALRGRPAIKGNFSRAHFPIYVVTRNLKNITFRYCPKLKGFERFSSHMVRTWKVVNIARLYSILWNSTLPINFFFFSSSLLLYNKLFMFCRNLRKRRHGRRFIFQSRPQCFFFFFWENFLKKLKKTHSEQQK